MCDVCPRHALPRLTQPPGAQLPAAVAWPDSAGEYLQGIPAFLGLGGAAPMPSLLLSLLLLPPDSAGMPQALPPSGQAGLEHGAEHVCGCLESCGRGPACSLLVLLFEQILVGSRECPIQNQAFRAVCIEVSSSMRHASIEEQCTSYLQMTCSLLPLVC